MDQRNVAMLLQKVELQISTSSTYHKTPITFVKTLIFSLQFQVQIDTDCAHQVKSSSVATHQAAHNNGPSGRPQQQQP
jgi:hypothetical protein